MPHSLANLADRARERRLARRRKIRAAAKARATELTAHHSLLVDYFDRLTNDQLLRIYRAAIVHYPDRRGRDADPIRHLRLRDH